MILSLDSKAPLLGIDYLKKTDDSGTSKSFFLLFKFNFWI
jgi:hypothetical protein